MSLEGPDGSALPPGLSPRAGSTRGRRPRSSGSGRLGRFLRGVAVVTAAVVVLGSAAGYAAENRYLGKVHHVDAFVGLTNRPAKASDHAMNILLVGDDDRAGLTTAQKRAYKTGSVQTNNTDTMMLIHISPKTHHIIVTSIPRDTYALIPAHTANGVHVPAEHNKINAAYAEGGAPLMIETVEHMTGVRVDHYVSVGLGGFVKVVNAVGGVNICLKQPLYDPQTSTQGSGLNLPAGTSHINGLVALQFVRDRHSYANEDLGREQAQQRFMSAMIRKVTAPSVILDPVKLNRLLSTGLSSVQTDMSSSALLTLARQLTTYKPADISFLTVPIADSSGRLAPGIGSVLDWDQAQSNALWSVYRNDTSLDGESRGSSVVPSTVQVQVLNGSGITGLGARTATALHGLGFTMVGPARTAPTSGATVTTVTYSPLQEKEGKAVVAAIPNSVGQLDPSAGGTVTVTVGSNYIGVKSPTASHPKIAAKTAANNICG